jgi:hypothetical protein
MHVRLFRFDASLVREFIEFGRALYLDDARWIPPFRRTVATVPLDAARDWLRDQHGLRRIWGPMNFDIWHSYRFMTRGFDQALQHGYEDIIFALMASENRVQGLFRRSGPTPQREYALYELNA